MHEGRESLSCISFHLSSKRGPGLIRAAGTNRKIDAGTLKNDVPASISPQLPASGSRLIPRKPNEFGF